MRQTEQTKVNKRLKPHFLIWGMGAVVLLLIGGILNTVVYVKDHKEVNAETDKVIQKQQTIVFDVKIEPKPTPPPTSTPKPTVKLQTQKINANGIKGVPESILSDQETINPKFDESMMGIYETTMQGELVGTADIVMDSIDRVFNLEVTHEAIIKTIDLMLSGEEDAIVSWESVVEGLRQTTESLYEDTGHSLAVKNPFDL